MRGLIYEIAESKVFGSIQEVERAGLYDFFSYLAFKREQEKELEDAHIKRNKANRHRR
jgi:hypothetical protein